MIEILVVMAILGTLLGIAVPHFLRGRDRGQLREVVTGLREDLRYGRELAAASGGARTILFATQGGNPAREYHLRDSASGQDLRRRQLPAGFSLTEASLEFLESGGINRDTATPSPGSDGRVQLEVRSPQSAVTLQVQPETGQVVD